MEVCAPWVSAALKLWRCRICSSPSDHLKMLGPSVVVVASPNFPSSQAVLLLLSQSSRSSPARPPAHSASGFWGGARRRAQPVQGLGVQKPPLSPPCFASRSLTAWNLLPCVHLLSPGRQHGSRDPDLSCPASRCPRLRRMMQSASTFP